MAASIDQKCIFVVGPTASGKSSWALEMADKYKGSVVNIDSVQFYRGLMIGSAAPTEAEKKRVPHYLYSYVEAPQEMTAGRYLKDFYELIEKNPRFPLFITGGTGFYIQALEKGMFDVEPVPKELREEIEAELAQKGAEVLHQELLAKDPGSKIHVNDHFRLVRALEILRFTGEKPSELKNRPEKNKNSFPFPYIKVGFDFEKSDYVKKVEQRTRLMIAGGIIEETESFRKLGFSSWAPLGSVGYRETLEFLEQGHSRDWLQQAIVQSTMQLIKKQKTWFKRDRALLWSNQESALGQFVSSV